MGAYYFYVNKTRQTYFSIDPVLDQEIKQSFVGKSIGSRALGFLLLAVNPAECGHRPHELRIAFAAENEGYPNEFLTSMLAILDAE